MWKNGKRKYKRLACNLHPVSVFVSNHIFEKILKSFPRKFRKKAIALYGLLRLVASLSFLKRSKMNFFSKKQINSTAKIKYMEIKCYC